MGTKTENYDLFLGCTIQNRIPFIEKSARFVFEKLGISLSGNAEFGCCPDPVGVQSTSQHAWLALGARNLALAEQDNLPIVSFCNGCAETLKAVNHELMHNLDEKAAVNAQLQEIGKKYEGTIDVFHFIEVLHEHVGVERIKSLVKIPFKGLKVAIHPGCHYSRPSELVNVDEAIGPKFPSHIIEALGATVVDYQEIDMCCSSGVARNNETVANGMMKRKYSSIIGAGADVIGVICPSCFQQLEAGQKSMKKAFEMEVKLPVLYVTELMALAFGATMEEIGLKFHQIKPKNVFEAFGITK